MNAKSVQRRNDLDWLRVLGILLVFVYHSSRFYNVEDWNVKNNIWYPSVELWNGFATSFMMPLMFVISGASLFYALGKGGFGKFVKGKTLRLLLPLLVGALTHISLQAYLYNITHGYFSGNFFQFLPHYYNLNSIEWQGAHLWYLKYLFLFSIILYPLLRWLKGRGYNLLSKLAGVLARNGLVYILALPILLLFLLPPEAPLMDENGGWPYLMYMLFLLWGFVITSDERLQDSIQRLRWVSLSAGLVLVVGFVIVYSQIADPDVITPSLLLAGAMRTFGGWFVVLAILGLGAQYLTKWTPRLGYASEAVLPFYILHQTVLLAVGYFVLQWGIPEVLEWAVIVIISFAIIMGLYEVLVCRLNLLRFLFGMKPMPTKPVAEARQSLQVG